ncbi:hypothetical protein M2140_001506, partial [Clostridiales Family XIII bacterium PM5-7]
PVSFSGKLIIPESRVSGSFIFLNLHHYMGTTNKKGRNAVFPSSATPKAF